MKKEGSGLEGYQPFEWSAESQLTAAERGIVETQRKDLWRNGIRKQPMLDRMAFEFGYVICALKGAAR